MNFDDLAKDLGLKTGPERIQKTEALRTWSLQNISTDQVFTGTSEDIYDQYYAYVMNYLDRFLPCAQAGMSAVYADLGQLSPLHYAAQQGYDLYLSHLSKAAAAPYQNLKDQYGLTPLHYAGVFGQVATVKKFLEWGVAVNCVNQAKQTPLASTLMIPIIHEPRLLENKIAIAMILIDQMDRADLELPNQMGNTVMHEVASTDLTAVLIKLIEKNRELVFKENNFSRYPVHLAILNQKPDNLAVFLEIDGVEALADGKGRTPLHFAAYYGDKKLLERCCSLCRDLNIRDREQKTPLMQAAIAGRIDLIEVLIEKGADPFLKSAEKTAIDYARSYQKDEAVAYLENHAGSTHTKPSP